MNPTRINKKRPIEYAIALFTNGGSRFAKRNELFGKIAIWYCRGTIFDSPEMIISACLYVVP